MRSQAPLPPPRHAASLADMSLLDAIPIFARCNRLKKCDTLVASGGPVPETQKIDDADLAEANLISSEIVDGVHIPLIDIDMDAALLPSSTPGHHHLYIDKNMPFEDLIKLLEVMVEVGIVQKGFLEGTKKRGFSSLRLPHVSKYDQEEEAPKPHLKIVPKNQSLIDMEEVNLKTDLLTEKILKELAILKKNMLKLEAKLDNSELEW